MASSKDNEHRHYHSRGFGPPRFQEGPLRTALDLGPLAFLAGSWRGPGFNSIWRPDNGQPPENSKIHRFLELNLTNDSFDFHVIPGVVPNRGFANQKDLDLYGLTYLQRVSDADPKPPPDDPGGYSQTAGQALHIEPGLFMNVPASQQPNDGSTLSNGPTIVNKKTIVRMGSIPHGVTVLMQGPDPGTKPTLGPPNIPALSPFTEFPPPPFPAHPPLYPGLSPIPFPGPYPIAFPGAPVQPPPTPPGPNPPAVGIQPIVTGPAVSPTPPYLQHVIPEINIALDTLAPGSQSTGPFPPSFQGFINDPNSVLRDAIAGQDILGFIAINLTTDSVSVDGFPTLGVGSLYETVSNIPFLGAANRTPPNPLPAQPAAVATETNPVPNAFVYSASATFWIEWVRWEHGPRHHDPQYEREEYREIRMIEPFWPERTYLQLQYSQLVILIFNNILWPHVTVATMTLSAG
jgi:hypothetical protein